MSKLLPHETELIGRWLERDGKVIADPTCERIHQLTNGILDVVQDHPRNGGWSRLYRDTSDGRYWERFYPQGELHGGGPPALRCMDLSEVQKEYQCRPERLQAERGA